jgi:hypothetical protein
VNTTYELSLALRALRTWRISLDANGLSEHGNALPDSRIEETLQGARILNVDDAVVDGFAEWCEEHEFSPWVNSHGPLTIPEEIGSSPWGCIDRVYWWGWGVLEDGVDFGEQVCWEVQAVG